MPLMQRILLTMPTFALGAIMIFGSIAASAAGLVIVRRCIPIKKLRLHNDVAGFIFTTIGVIYGVILAFLVVVVWQDFDKSGSNAATEANCIADVYRDSEALSPRFRVETRQALDRYTSAIINVEWPLLAKGESSPEVEAISKNLWEMYVAYHPGTDTERVFFEESVKKLNEAGELRRLASDPLVCAYRRRSDNPDDPDFFWHREFRIPTHTEFDARRAHRTHPFHRPGPRFPILRQRHNHTGFIQADTDPPERTVKGGQPIISASILNVWSPRP